MLHSIHLFVLIDICFLALSYPTEYGIDDLNVMKWKNHEEELLHNSPYLEDLLANLARKSNKENEAKYQVGKDKKNYNGQMYPSVKCSSYNGQVVCDIDRYNIAIKDSAQKLDVDTLERITALIYNKLLKGDSTFQVGVNSKKNEVYSVHQDRASDINNDQRVYIECNPLSRPDSISKDQDVYECKWQNPRMPKQDSRERIERSASSQEFFHPAGCLRMKKTKSRVGFGAKKPRDRRDCAETPCPPPTPPCCPPKPPFIPPRSTCPPPKVPCPPEPSLPCPKCLQ